MASEEHVPYARSANLSGDQEFEPRTELDDAGDADFEQGGTFAGAQPGSLAADPADRDIVIVAAADNSVVDDPDDDLAGDDLAGADADVAVAGRHDMPPADARHRNGDVGREWHDIQAMFVDDPRGSVEMAAAAADAAVDALVAMLHQRQSALTPAVGAEHESGETEQLREALRSYRIFCQNVADLGHQLTEPATMAG